MEKRTVLLMARKQHMKKPFTTSSAEELLQKVAETLRSEELDRYQGTPDTLDQEVIARGQAPGLSCCVRVARNLRQCIGFESSVEAAAKKPPETLYLLVDFRQTPAEDELALARKAPTPDRYRALTQTQRQVTLHIRLGGSRHRNRWQRAQRLAEKWRFYADRPPPLEEWVQKERQKGNVNGADHVQAVLNGLPAEIKAKRQRREATAWREIYIHPQRQTVADIHFLLSLALLQEDMIPPTQALKARARQYLKGFNGISDDSTADDVLSKLRLNFTKPEDWRALRYWVKRVVRTPEAGQKRWEVPADPEKVHQREVRHDQRGIPRLRTLQLDAQEKSPRWSPTAAADLLTREGRSVTPDALYDWINAGKIPYRQELGRRWLDAEGLEQARQRLVVRELRKAIRERLRKGGKTQAAAEKWARRHIRLGMTMLEIEQKLQALGTAGCRADQKGS